MKLAVIFLCLSVASFIGTSKVLAGGLLNGGSGGLLNGGGGKKGNQQDLCCLVFFLTGCISSWNDAEKCDDGDEKSIRLLILAGQLYRLLFLICNTLGCTMEELLKSLDCSDDEIAACVSGNADSILKACRGNLTALLKKLMRVVEYIFALLNILLLDLLTDICNSWGLDDLLSGCSCLCTSIDEVLDIVDILLANLVGGLVAIVFGTLLGTLSGLVGLAGLLSLAC
ncbi:uncharacterized protein [Eleutherodactylus coqui]|uniref:uncharacterized protein n=1 Tax=Eleutherodactylus coqui TaxID=57060 RepID=UPI003462B514